MSDFKGNNLVQLQLVNPFELEPIPDKDLQGRLSRVLKQVGAKGFISVRARMITAVSNTKFKTAEGWPVSMVGLHGKDEMLVQGPVWALEMLANGDSIESESGLIQEHLEHLRGFVKSMDEPEQVQEEKPGYRTLRFRHPSDDAKQWY